MKMTVDVNKTWHIAVVNLSGNVDQDAFQAVKDKTLELIKHGIKNILLDFSDVDFMSLVGLKAISEISERLDIHQETPFSKAYHLRVLHPQNTSKSNIKNFEFDAYPEINKDKKDSVNGFQCSPHLAMVSK